MGGRVLVLAAVLLWFTAGAVFAQVGAGEVLRPAWNARGDGDALQDFKILRLVRVGASRYLAVIQRSVAKRDRRSDREPVPHQLSEKSVTQEPGVTFEDSVGIAFLDRGGKLHSASFAGLEGFAPPSGRSGELLVVAPERPPCPYAVYRPDERELVCFDWQLNSGRRYGVPLEVLTGAAPVSGDAGGEVWFFGRNNVGNAQRSQASPWQERWEGGQFAAFRLVLETGAWVPLPARQGDLERVVRQEVTRTPGREPVPGSRPAVLAVVPDENAAGQARLILAQWVRVQEARDREPWEERVFFLAEVNRDGFVRLQKLPLRLRKGSQAKAELDQKSGTILLPPVTTLADVQPFLLPGRAVGLWLSFFVWEDEADRQAAIKGEQRSVQMPAFLAALSKDEGRLFDFSDVRTAVRNLTTPRSKVLPVPIYLGSGGAGEVLFAALCRDRQEETRCVVSVQLGP